MNSELERVIALAETQHDVVAAWQLKELGWEHGQIHRAMRHLRKVHHGVRALGDLTDLGWYMAAALACGPGAAISHLSALRLMGLRPYGPGDIHVTFDKRTGTSERDGIIPHKPRRRPEVGTYDGIPVTSPTQSLRDANLQPHELYRALEAAEQRAIPLDLPSLPRKDIVELKQRVTGYTRSDTEAKFLLLCHDHGLPLPLVNRHLNGFETDFHWPQLRLVDEVDGWEHHREHGNFNTDRHRGLVHRVNGYEVIRVSADHVYDQPELVVQAVVVRRSAAPCRADRCRRSRDASRRRTSEIERPAA